MNQRESEIYEAVFGKTDYRPLVRFYKHATLDAELTAHSGRPRFAEKTYVMIQPRHPDLHVRDRVSREATTKDKAEYTEEYQAYLDQVAKEEMLIPPLRAIPDMNVVAFKELEALNIHDCKDLAESDADLGYWNRMKDTAKKIMRISNELLSDHEQRSLEYSQGVHKEREEVRYRATRPEYTGEQTQDGGQVTPDRATGFGGHNAENLRQGMVRGHFRRDGSQKVTHKEEKDNETFRYEITA